MKTSFITTVLNEEDTIHDFLNALAIQSKKPDEIVIVDGGSTDKTLSVISNFIHSISSGSSKFKISNKFKIKIIKKKGNRSVGRNEAIRRASGDIIVVSDAGCILDKDWLKNITKPFSKGSIDVVAGYYKPLTKNVFERCLATYTCVMSDKVDPENFLPSSRSIAFKKKAWEKAGRYPEWLDTCEDLVFAKNMKRAGMSFVFAKNAFVYWPQRENLFQAFRQFFSYAIGDGRAHFFRPKKTWFLFSRYILAGILLYLYLHSKSTVLLMSIIVFLTAYIYWSIQKNLHYNNDVRAFFYLPLLQITSDIAVILGTSYGLLSSKKYSLSSVYK